MKGWTALILTLFLILTTPVIAQDKLAPSGLTGKVVDMDGNPVENFSFAIVPMDLVNGRLNPRGSRLFREVLKSGLHFLFLDRANDTIDKIIQGQSYPNGMFSVSDIPPGLIRLHPVPHFPEDAFNASEIAILRHSVLRDVEPPDEMIHRVVRKPDKRIHSIQFGNITVFETSDDLEELDEGLAFALPLGETIENVKITVIPRLRIHARVVFADGTPVANAQTQLNMQINSEQVRPGSFRETIWTDPDGYFTHYVDDPGIYTISIGYSGLKAGAKPFGLTKNKPIPKNLVLTLDGNAAEKKKRGYCLNNDIRSFYSSEF